MTSTIGFEEEDAKRVLESQGFKVTRIEYCSKKGVDGADSIRVIRQRPVSDNCIEITVSRFKTKI